MMLKKASVIFFLSLCLMACSRYATRGEQLYLDSKNETPIKISSYLSEKNVNHEFNLTSPNRNPIVSLAPPDSKEIKQA